MSSVEHYIRSALVALGLLLIQTTFLPFLSVAGFLPDLFLIWIVFLAITRGQMEAMIVGFLAGLMQDAVTIQFFGLTALTKTLAGFIAGYFYNDNITEQTLGSYRFILITLFASLVHNLVFYGIFLQGVHESVFLTMIEFSIASSLYTGILALLPMFTFVRKYRFSQSL